MGEHQVHDTSNEQRTRAFVRAMLEDISALEVLIEQDLIECGVCRVGVEQEMYIVDKRGNPSPVFDQVLKHLGDKRFTTELAKFNLEVNLAPFPIGGDFLRTMERGLGDVYTLASRAANKADASIVLTGTLPTLRNEHVSLSNLTPELRYQCLNDTCMAARSGKFTLVIDGVDRFEESYESVVIEGASTSFQVHLQVEPERAGALYNLAQLITAPILAVAANSPILINQRLWHETRVALFERAIEYRSKPQMARSFPSRVGFGEAWVRESVLEIFRENAMRYHVIMIRDPIEDPFAALEQGRIPELGALALHNGTVWRWNRPCYGITNGKPHLRIENRALPAGPTIIDEVANAALFYGIMQALEAEADNIPDRIAFEDARDNFLAAAKFGLDADFTWLDQQQITARELLKQILIPAAYRGLKSLKVPAEDIKRYLSVIEGREENSQTGATWLLDSLASVSESERAQACRDAVAIMLERQSQSIPVHRWEPLKPSDCNEELQALETLRDIMTTDLFTVRPEDLLDLATSMMDWKHFRHVPVESSGGKLVGLLSTRQLLRIGTIGPKSRDQPIAVSEVMQSNPLTMSPDTPLHDAFAQILRNESGCLLVVSDDRLLGIVTERDLLEAAVARLSE
ncbi:MAG: CBS domain-containing protein [Arenicellales bacterium]